LTEAYQRFMTADCLWTQCSYCTTLPLPLTNENSLLKLPRMMIGDDDHNEGSYLFPEFVGVSVSSYSELSDK